jgi:hypothetical protein
VKSRAIATKTSNMSVKEEFAYIIQRKNRRKRSEWIDYMYFNDHERAIEQYRDMITRPIHHDARNYPGLRVIFKEIKETQLVSND